MQMNGKILRLVIIAGIFTAGTLVLHGCYTGMQKGPRQEADATIAFDINKIFEKEAVVPVAIIGAGPAGLTAALYTAPQYDTVVIEGGERPSALTGSHKVENWPSLVKSGEGILADIKVQAEARGARFIQQEVTQLNMQQSPFEITLSDGSKINALTIIISLGAYPRKLGIPGEEKYWGRGVSSCATCDAMFYKGKDVVVIGGGDSAIEEATVLARFARSITIIHRREAMRASAAMQTRLVDYRKKSSDDAPGKIDVMLDVVVEKIVGNGDGVTGIVIRDNKTGQERQMAIDGVFLAIGHEPNTKLVAGKIALDEQGYIVLPNQVQNKPAQATSVPGVFAAGDVSDPRYRQAITAAGHGSQAAKDAIDYLEAGGLTLQLAKQLKEGAKPA